jgi:hypothetical protein
MMEFVAKPGCVAFEGPDQAQYDKTRVLLAYWHELHRLHARPARSDLDPAAMKPLLANLLTGNVETKPFRIHYKLVGTRVAECSRFDFTNRYLDELASEDRDDVDWEACYRQLHRLRRPLIGEANVKGAGGLVIDSYEFAILPLWRGEDPAGSFVAIEVYDGIVAHRVPDWSRVQLRA